MVIYRSELLHRKNEELFSLMAKPWKSFLGCLKLCILAFSYSYVRKAAALILLFANLGELFGTFILWAIETLVSKEELLQHGVLGGRMLLNYAPPVNSFEISVQLVYYTGIFYWKLLGKFSCGKTINPGYYKIKTDGVTLHLCELHYNMYFSCAIAFLQLINGTLLLGWQMPYGSYGL